ncbi:MAG: DUF4870 domain-containing protein [bacterium]
MLKQNEREASALIHVGIIIPGWGLLIAGLVWFYFKELSRRVVFQAQQAIFFQILLLLAGVVALLLGNLCKLVEVVSPTFGEMLAKFNFWLFAGVFGVYAAVCLFGVYKVLCGEEFRYPIVGKRLAEQMGLEKSKKGGSFQAKKTEGETRQK